MYSSFALLMFLGIKNYAMPPETLLADKTRACSRPLPISGAYDMVFKSFFAVDDCVIAFSITLNSLFGLAKLADYHWRYAITMPISEGPLANRLGEGTFSL